MMVAYMTRCAVPAAQVELARQAGFADAVHYELAGGLMGVLVGTRRR